MSLGIVALNHACNVVRRQFQDEIKNLTLFFIVHAPGERVKAFESKRDELLALPGGAEAMEAVKLCSQFKPDTSMFVGLGEGVEEKFFSFLKTPKNLAVFFMNVADFDDENDMYQRIYHLTWQALSLIEHYKAEKTDFYLVNDGAIRPAYNLLNLSRENMLGDAFSAIIMELQGHKHYIQTLARKRCQMCLKPVTGYRSEHYPYPIAADATQIVYEELTEEHSSKVKLITQAIEITKEIGFTYDDNSIRQWMEFSGAAQEMAWLDYNSTRILSMAIYASEDPYVRSTAYIVSEILNMEPSILADLNEYNPYADNETNERLHAKLCNESFETLIQNAKNKDDTHLFIEKARAQNEKLLTGQVTGWCAYSMLEAGEAFKQAFLDDENPEEQAKIAFKEAQEILPWDGILKVGKLIMNKKRQGFEITTPLVIDLCEDHSVYHPVAEALLSVSPVTGPDIEEKLNAVTKDKEPDKVEETSPSDGLENIREKNIDNTDTSKIEIDE